MSILSEQLVISDKVISNVITTDPVAESVTMRNGYYFNHKYPDNRTVMTGENPWTGIKTSFGRSFVDQIAISETAGQIG